MYKVISGICFVSCYPSTIEGVVLYFDCLFGLYFKTAVEDSEPYNIRPDTDYSMVGKLSDLIFSKIMYRLYLHRDSCTPAKFDTLEELGSCLHFLLTPYGTIGEKNIVFPHFRIHKIDSAEEVLGYYGVRIKGGYNYTGQLDTFIAFYHDEDYD